MKKVRLFLIAASVLAAVSLHAVVLQEKFVTDPLLGNWQIFGDATLFQWNATNHNMDVTWDSAQTNSYFYRPLGVTYTKADSFCVVFDLSLKDVDAIGYFQLAAGLCKFSDATSTNFSRANAVSPNLFEFDYFPDGPLSYGPSINGTLVDANSSFYFAYDTSAAMPTNVTFHVVLLHPAGAAAVEGILFTNNAVFTRLPQIGAYGADDFQVDTLAICNYTTLDDIYGDSLTAHGTVDNFGFASPIPVGAIQTLSAGQVQFNAATNWIYSLQGSVDFQHWNTVATVTNLTAANLTLEDTNVVNAKMFYRVNADLP
jgi:hypothetical protein